MIRKRPDADNTITDGPKYRNIYWEDLNSRIKCMFCQSHHDVSGRQLDDRGKLVIPPTCPRCK